MTSFRSAIKDVLERSVVWSGAALLARRRMAGRSIVLAYHNIVPDDTPPLGDLPNHLPLSMFVAQLEEIQATHDVVPLSETMGASRSRSGRPRVAITFDDAYRGAVVHGVQALVRARLPATIFVTPGFLGGKSFWWDALAGEGVGGLSPALRDHALNELRGEDAAVREWAAAEGHRLTVVPDVACAASEGELKQAATSPGITLGSHTWSHPNLARLNGPELDGELARPLAWLRAFVPDPLPWIAYPYGLFNAGTLRAAAAAGYEAGLAISGGFYPASVNERFSLPRVNITPGLSPRGFVLRGAGFLAG